MKQMLFLLVMVVSTSSFASADLGKCFAQIRYYDETHRGYDNTRGTYGPSVQIDSDMSVPVLTENQKYQVYLGVTSGLYTLFVVEKSADPKEMTDAGRGIKKHLAVNSDKILSHINLSYFNDEVMIEAHCN